MYYRFQNNTELQTSVHPYPSSDIIDLYANENAVKKMIARIESGEVPFDDVCNYDSLDNYYFKENFVCCHWIDEDELEETMEFEGSTCVAYDDYVVVFDAEEDFKIFDGYVAKAENIVAIYKKTKNNQYRRIG